MLAQLRGEDLETTFRETLNNLLGCVPSRIIERNVVRDLDFTSVEIENGLTKLRLANGRVFFAYPSRTRYVNIFNALQDIIPGGFTAETYQAGVDVVARYQRGADYHYFPGQGGVVIEGGAFIGYKAVRFAEVVGPTGKVIAIEIGRRNHELLCKNVHANGMEGIITPVHCGIWNKTGSMNAEFEYANAYHLAAPDEHHWCTQEELVPVDTLDNIIDHQNLETVDFLNLQLNGSEYEGLEGLDRRFNDVKILRIAAYYTRNGVKQVDVILQLLRKRGCKILAVGRINNVIAATPRFADQFEPMPSCMARNIEASNAFAAGSAKFCHSCASGNPADT